jgi:hypothetical protein
MLKKRKIGILISGTIKTGKNNWEFLSLDELYPTERYKNLKCLQKWVLQKCMHLN